MPRYSADVVPQWADLSQSGRENLVADLKACINGSNVGQTDLAARYFLNWLVTQTEDKCSDAPDLLRALSGDRPDAWTDGDYTKKLLDVFLAWRAYLHQNEIFSRTTRVAYTRRLAALFESVGESDFYGYPPFPRTLVSVPSEAGNVQTLGELGWPECKTLIGLKRERFCLDFLKADAIKAAEAEISLFTHGQTILAGGEPSTRVETRAWMKISDLLRNEQASFERTGFSSFIDGGDSSWINDKAAIIRTYSNVNLWIDAGFSEAQVQCLGITQGSPGSAFIFTGIDCLVLPCLGPTARLVRSIGLAFACETGWNAQPIFTMPRDPMIDGTVGETGIWGAVFFESFKNRAGHTIMARLRDGQPVPEQRYSALWKTTREEVDPNGTGDGYAVLPNKPAADGGVLQLLRRYESLSSKARGLDKRGNASERFFFIVTRKRGIVVGNDFIMRKDDVNRPMTRPNVGFRAIRKSYLNCRYVELGSTQALQRETGTPSSDVLHKYYLTTSWVKEQHVEHLRFFQNAVQTVVLDRLDDPAVDLVASQDDRAWFRRLASLAGVAASMGTEQSISEDNGMGSILTFSPTSANLTNLYLIHLGLKRCRLVVGRARWSVQGVPLLAAIKAIGHAMARKGFMPAYLRAARTAHRELSAGRIAIPPILEA